MPLLDGSSAHPIAHPPYVVVAQGVDLLVVNVLGRLHWQVRQALDLLQEEALAERDALHGRRRQAVLVETPWRLLDQPLLVRPHGGGNAQWRWLLTCPCAPTWRGWRWTRCGGRHSSIAAPSPPGISAM